MKIKVTFEKIYDSDDWFDEDYDYTQNEFEDIICEDIYHEDIDFSDEVWKFEVIEENDCK